MKYRKNSKVRLRAKTYRSLERENTGHVRVDHIPTRAGDSNLAASREETIEEVGRLQVCEVANTVTTASLSQHL